MLKPGKDIFGKSEDLADRLDDIVSKLIVEFDPQKILLFGSYARGDFKSTSTMDILIVADTPMIFTERIKKALLCCRGGFPPIEPIIYTPEEYKVLLEEAEEAFLTDALSEGIVVYEKE